ncbi:hypothetical protein EYC84_008479 [Monilinia fructicola]|uniref:Sorting nexin MVP1 n=1 Tax=Monilinia fructicola TaxID=38448 RepID=A0A5M9JFB1_MONFR|nr:hypothetical protein EYC84_008479 [Monilinia fructicola]
MDKSRHHNLSTLPPKNKNVSTITQPLLRICRSAPTLVTPLAAFLAPSIQSRNASILSNLSDNPGAYSKHIRRGRGPSSGKGKTSGRGHKGQKQHGKVPARFQGGQTPQHIVHGVRGFENQFSVDMSPINLNRIQEWIDQGRLDPTRLITLKELADSRCLHGVKDGYLGLPRQQLRQWKQSEATVITRFYTKPAIKRLLAGESVSSSVPLSAIDAQLVSDSPILTAASAASPFSYRLPDPTSLEEGQGPSLFFRAPRTGNFQKKSKKTGTAAAARDNRIWLGFAMCSSVDSKLFDQRPAKLNLKGNIWRPTHSGSLQIQPYARLHEYGQVTTRRDIMSLFGEIDEPAAATNPSKSRLSLFDDEPTSTPGSKSSLFADDDDISGGSPWNTSVPKKLAREDLLKTLLPTSDVPESYIDIFDDMIKDGKVSNGKLSADDVEGLLIAAKLSPDKISWILTIIIPSGGEPRDLERNEVNVLLALIGLAQEEEDIQDVTLDGVDERRRNLPVPHFITSDPTTASPSNYRPSISDESICEASSTTFNATIYSLEFPESDPWGSPALHKGHNHASPRSNGAPTNGTREPVRTTSNFTTSSAGGSNGSRHQQSVIAPAEPSTGGWGSYDTNANFNNSVTPPVGESGGFGGDGGEGGRSEEPAPQARTFGGGRVTGNGVEENIVVTLLAEKEECSCFNITIIKSLRFAEEARLQIPLLPPKRVAAAESSFMEKRRRGLARFSNALVKHPVLSQEQLVIMFLTVPTELAVWRKQATISVQEEFVGRPLPPGLEDSLPPTLNDLFAQTRTGIRRSADAYVNMCNLMDRLAKRNEGLAADHLRMALCLQSLTDASQDTYAIDTDDVPLLNEGLHSTAKHLSNCQSLLEDEAKAWDQGVLEDLKRQRDSLVSMRDMFDRRDRYDKDNIPYLERRIQNNENKLVTIRAKPEHLVKPGEIERLTEAIIKDKESIVAQHARGIFIKECIKDELVYFQSTQYNISRLSQDWAQERVKYSELQADNWKQLQEELESMPLGGLARHCTAAAFHCVLLKT